MSYKLNPFTGEFDFFESSGSSFLFKKTDTVSIGQTKVIDTILISSFISLDYSFTVYNNINSKTKTFKMNVTNKIDDSVYAINGDYINYTISAIQNGPNLEIIIVNNDSFVLDLILIRATL